MDMSRWGILFAVLACIALSGVLLPSFLGPPPHVSGASYVGPPSDPDPSGKAHEALLEAYQRKFAHPGYAEHKSRPGLPSEFVDFPEEREIKAIRAGLAGALRVPRGVEPTHVPTRQGLHVVIDGVLDDPAWAQAARFPIGVNGARSTVWLMADDRFLYVACDVPEDVTEAGYDQFRFYVHVGLSPWIVNERVHVGATSRGRVGGIRQTTVPWPHGPSQGPDDRWKDAPISDWQIYEHAQGASAFQRNRSYELVLELAECGLARGRPFTARIEVETDPLRTSDGTFVERRWLGRAGQQDRPLWFYLAE